MLGLKCVNHISKRDSSLRWRHDGRDGVSNNQPFIQAQIKENIKSSASLAFVRGIHRWPVNSPHKWPVTRKMFPFDDVIMSLHWPYHSPWHNCHRLRRSPLWYDGHSSQSAVPVSANPAALGRTSFLFVKWTYNIHVYHIKYARGFVVSALLWLHNPFLMTSESTFYHGPVTKYVKLRVAHEPWMFSPPPT